MYSDEGTFFIKEEYNQKGMITIFHYKYRYNSRIEDIEIKYEYNDNDILITSRRFVDLSLDRTKHYSYLDSYIIEEEFDYLNMKVAKFEYTLDKDGRVIKTLFRRFNPISQRAYETAITSILRDEENRIIQLDTVINDKESSIIIRKLNEFDLIESEYYYLNGKLKGKSKYYYFNFVEGYWLNQIVEIYIYNEDNTVIIEKEYWKFTILKM